MYERTFRAAFLLFVAVLAVCAASAQARVRATHAGTTHTLVVDTSFGLQTLDPTFGQTLTRLAAHARWDTLLTYQGGSLVPKPLLATGWKSSSQNKVFTFTLRKNAKFADGTALTSADVLFSFKRGQALKGDAASLLNNLTVSAPGKYTVVLRSTVPNAAVPAQSSLLLDREHAVAVAQFLRDDLGLKLDHCSNVTGIDWLDRKVTKKVKVKQTVEGGA